VYDNPVQFIFKIHTQCLSVLLDPINTDVHFPTDNISLGVVKGDDVREVVVLQVLLVNAEKKFIGTENEIDRATFLAFFSNHGFYPSDNT